MANVPIKVYGTGPKKLKSPSKPSKTAISVTKQAIATKDNPISPAYGATILTKSGTFVGENKDPLTGEYERSNRAKKNMASGATYESIMEKGYENTENVIYDNGGLYDMKEAQGDLEFQTKKLLQSKAAYQGAEREAEDLGKYKRATATQEEFNKIIKTTPRLDRQPGEQYFLDPLKAIKENEARKTKKKLAAKGQVYS